ncbi:hypothetical protein [Microbacterium dauci]|uniref:HTH cro/C1-type domain-containing protein n=1 Tax=Microbacterium dauci TaxID=3048008 RepID=A0ABT6ZGZ8_9MICO|nr:hypothetical protein [Microbacterium sp. LX3-4]MDJ1115398.1 hypothetical protein [Microbacterium sp. LX3-4]
MNTVHPTTDTPLAGPFTRAIAKELRARIDDISVAKLILIAHNIGMTVAEFWELISGNVEITTNQIDWIADHLGVTPYEIVAYAEMNA